MLLTMTPDPVPYDQAFDAIKAAVDAMPAGVKLFINSGTSGVCVLSSRICPSLSLQASFMGTVTRQPTWTYSLRSTGSTLDMQRGLSCPLKGHPAAAKNA